MSEGVPRAEYDKLERRVAKLEQAARMQETTVRIMQVRMGAIGMGGLGINPLLGMSQVGGGSYGQLAVGNGSGSSHREPRSTQRSRSPRLAISRHSQREPEVELPSAEEFAHSSGLDDKCLEVLMKQSPEVQQYVISQGPVEGRNPSAMVMGRIAKATSQVGVMGGSSTMGGSAYVSGGMDAVYVNSDELADQVEDFISENSVDDKCAESLRSQPPRVQAAVLNLGPAEGRNSSAMVMGRIAKASRGEI